MPAVADMVKYISLSTLLMRWNRIAAKGLTDLCGALEKTDSLKSLDLSFNPLSKKSPDLTDKYPECLADMFRVNTSIVHMDLSHTGITVGDAEVLSKGLNENHTIYGLHLTGNEISVTADGFITQDRRSHAADSHIMVRVSESLLMGVPESKINMDLRA